MVSTLSIRKFTKYENEPEWFSGPFASSLAFESGREEKLVTITFPYSALHKLCNHATGLHWNFNYRQNVSTEKQTRRCSRDARISNKRHSPENDTKSIFNAQSTEKVWMAMPVINGGLVWVVKQWMERIHDIFAYCCWFTFLWIFDERYIHIHSQKVKLRQFAWR